MAITLVGTAEVANTTQSAMSVALPAGTTTNDVVYAFQCCPANPGIGVTTSGYTTLFSHTGASTRIGGFRKVMGGTPDTTIAFSASAAGGNAAVIIVLRGVDTTTPEDATTVSQSTDTNSTNPDPPSITTVTTDAWVLACAGSGVSDTSVTAPTGYSNQVDINAAPGFGNVTAGLASKVVTSPGAENPGTWTNWSSGNWRGASIAVRPAAVSGGAKSYGFIMG